MPNYDDLFTGQTTQQEEKPFDKAAWAARKQAEREGVYAMIDNYVQNMSKEGGLFQAYLDVQARFDLYSVSNAILIAAQCPEATKLADFDSWKASGVYVRHGADAITIHGRTRAQMYAPPVDWDIIRQVKEAVKIPVIGNGDVDSPQAARALLDSTGCDLVMVGRGALGRPWLLGQIREYLTTRRLLPDPPMEERMPLMSRRSPPSSGDHRVPGGRPGPGPGRPGTSRTGWGDTVNLPDKSEEILQL